jgi:hypothetical protein
MEQTPPPLIAVHIDLLGGLAAPDPRPAAFVPEYLIAGGCFKNAWYELLSGALTATLAGQGLLGDTRRATIDIHIPRRAGPIGPTGQDSIFVFCVRDWKRSARAVKTQLESLGILARCRVSRFDPDEFIWRPIWPLNAPAFDPDYLCNQREREARRERGT